MSQPSLLIFSCGYKFHDNNLQSGGLGGEERHGRASPKKTPMIRATLSYVFATTRIASSISSSTSSSCHESADILPQDLEKG